MLESVNLSFVSRSKKESLFNTFHNLCTEKRHERYFLSTMEKCGIEVNKFTNVFYQLMDAMLSRMLKQRNRKLIPVSTRPQNVELEESEIETLSYIAAFIVFFPEKKFEKYNPFAAQISVLFECWGSKSDSDFGSFLEEYTNAWVDLVNRGGIHQHSDKFYLLIKAVKIEARTILNQELLINYCGEDLKTVLYTTCPKSENFEVCWHNISPNSKYKEVVSQRDDHKENSVEVDKYSS